MCCGGAAGSWCGREAAEGLFLLAAAFCRTAAVDAQVGGRVVGGILKGDNDAVQDTFECVDLSVTHVLVGIVEGTAHHNEEQELEQHGQEASSGRCFAGRCGTAPSGDSL